MCGRVVGYQYASPDAVVSLQSHNDINSYYVDGVSITRGSPLQHVRTLMAGLVEADYHVNDPSQGHLKSPRSQGKCNTSVFHW